MNSISFLFIASYVGDKDLAGLLRTSQGAFFLRNTAAQLRFCRTAKSYVRESAPHDEDGVVVVVPGRNGPGATMVALAVGADSAANPPLEPQLACSARISASAVGR